MSNRCAHILIGLFIVVQVCFGQGTSTQPALEPAGESQSQPEADVAADTQPAEAPATQSALPTKKEADKPLFGKDMGKNSLDTSSLVRQMMAMLVIIGVLGVVCWYVMKRGLPKLKGVGSRRVRVEETTYLAGRHMLHLVRVGSRRVLVASGREGVRSLGDVTDAFGADEDFREALQGSMDSEDEAGGGERS